MQDNPGGTSDSGVGAGQEGPPRSGCGKISFVYFTFLIKLIPVCFTLLPKCNHILLIKLNTLT